MHKQQLKHKEDMRKGKKITSMSELKDGEKVWAEGYGSEGECEVCIEDQDIFLLSNNPAFEGFRAENLRGYKYSYILNRAAEAYGWVKVFKAAQSNGGDVAIKALTREHGAKIVKYFKDLGIDTGDYIGGQNEKDGNMFIYYGTINGSFNNFSKAKVIEKKIDIILLPEECLYKREEALYMKREGKGFLDKVVYVCPVGNGYSHIVKTSKHELVEVDRDSISREKSKEILFINSQGEEFTEDDYGKRGWYKVGDKEEGCFLIVSSIVTKDSELRSVFDVTETFKSKKSLLKYLLEQCE